MELDTPSPERNALALGAHPPSKAFEFEDADIPLTADEPWPDETVERIFKSQEKILIRWLTSTLGDMDTAKDVAQNTFIKLWMYSLDNPIRSPKTLLFKIASFLAIDEIRRRKRSRRRFVSSDDLNFIDAVSEVSSTEPTPEEAINLKQQADLTLRAIINLPSKSRTAFRMHRFEGRNYEEIAQQMNVSKSSVEKYMITALKELRAVS